MWLLDAQRRNGLSFPIPVPQRLHEACDSRQVPRPQPSKSP